MSSVTAARAAVKPRAAAYTFLTSAEYFTTLKSRIDAAQAGDRIVLVTLRVRAEQPIIDDIVQSLYQAGKRGAHITLLIDAYHFLIKEGAVPGLAFFFGPGMRVLPKFLKKRQQALDLLQSAGVNCQIINQPSRPLKNPFRGRSHIKYSIINDEVFIGGCNIGDPAFLDVMVGWHDKQIADWLCELGDSFAATGRVSAALASKDLEVPVDSHTTLLIDAGATDQSVIMDRALGVIDGAQRELLMTCQFFPHGPTAKHMLAAVKRGATLRAFYNHPAQHRLPLNIIYGAAAWRVRQGPVEFSKHRLPRKHAYLHAKILTSERAALLSSHNYMITGVQFGTAEIGLISTDPAFVRELNATLLRQLQ